MGFTFNRRIELRNTETQINKRDTCLLISSLMTSAFIAGDGVIINVSINYKANITAVDYKELNVEGMNCWLSVHYVPTAKLSKGWIEIKNTNNYIDIKNV